MTPSLLVSSSCVSLMGDIAELDNHFLKLLLSRPAMVLLRVMLSTRRLMAAARCMRFSLSVNSTVAMERR